MELLIRAKDHSHVVMQLAKYYNKRAWLIYRLPDSNMFMCKNCVELEPVSKDVDTMKAIKNLKPSWLKD